MRNAVATLLLGTALSSFAVAASAQVNEEAPPQRTGDPVADAKIEEDVRQDPKPTARGSDDIVVTGTRIVRPNNHSAAPITTTTAAEIAQQGATTIEEVFNRLPQVAPNSEQNFSDSSGRQRIKLRSLGFERTLTLVDGLRLGLQNGMDVSIIPTALVERIDILSGGASSVYGSDAISGVINFVMKKNFEGVSLDGSYSLYNHDNRDNAVSAAARRANFAAPLGMANDGGRANLNLAAGKSFFDGRLNITGFASYRHSDQVSLSDRSLSACEVTQPVRDGPFSCTASTYTTAGTILPGRGSFANQALVNDPQGSGRFIGYNTTAGTANNPYDGYAFQREFDRINAGGFLSVDLSKAAEIYGSLLWYRDKSQNPIPLRLLSYTALGTTPYQVNCNNPFLSGSQAAAICGAQAGTSALAPIDVRYRFDGLSPAANRFVNQGTRATLGLRGSVFGDVWKYDVAGVYASNRGTTTSPSNPDYVRINRTLNVVNVNGTPTCVSVVNGSDPSCVPFNAFAPFQNPANVANYIFAAGDAVNYSIPVMFQGVGTITGDLGKYGVTSPFAEQGIAFAVGLEYRDEKLINRANPQFRLTNGGVDSRYRQTILEGNMEIQVPVVENQSWTKLLQFNGGYRRSKYNQLDGAFSTWKAEGIWSPIGDLTLRASFNKAQRAPTLTQAVSASDINFTRSGGPQDPCGTVPDPQRPGQTLPPRATIEQCRATGLPDNLYGSPSLACPDALCTIRNGGFSLTPETAYTKTFGAVIRPRFLPGLTLSIDRWIIDLKDAIRYYGAADTLNECLRTKLDFFCRFIVRDPSTFTLSAPAIGNPAAGYIGQGTSNGYKGQSYGWDVQAQWTIGLERYGRLDLSLNGTRMTLQGGQDTPIQPKRNCVGFYGPPCGEGIPKWTHTFRTTYVTPDRFASISLNWRYIGPLSLTYNVTDVSQYGFAYTAADRRNTYNRIDAYSYFDLAATFEVDKRMSLRLSVNNIFDKEAPLVPDSRNLLGLLRSNTLFRYDLLGRQIIAGATLKF